tara:strand:+ start:623 stop:2059 length:1437 start_codon:yes stop_codon:yes gene_type:complete
MRFFLCNDKSKFTKSQNIKQYGDWYFIHEDDVKVYEDNNHLVLYCGYLIEGDIIEACKNFSFDDENGNFFAIKLTKDTYEISLDYFQNHKIFVADKYGIEISNYIPYMTINHEDVVRTEYFDATELEFEREFEDFETFYGHIDSFIPSYDYLQDATDAFKQEIWDSEELTEYVYNCMESHSSIIKENYPLRYCSLSEGIDSAVQSAFFYDDLQLLYDISPCDAGDIHLRCIKTQQKRFPNTQHYTWHTKDNKQNCLDYLTDSSCRWQSILPTCKQVASQDKKPDIVMYGVNGNEMFVRDFIPHMLLLCLTYYEHDTIKMKEKLHSEIDSKRSHYGVTYSLPSDGNWITTDTYVTAFMREYFKEHIQEKPYLWKEKQKTFKHNFLMVTTPKLYTRMISNNNNVMCSSLYNDRRIFHEILKMKNHYLVSDIMNGPIQRSIINKFEQSFTTPSNDVLAADYDELYLTTYEATHERDLGQHI